MKKLNLGCGADIRRGYVNVDFCKLSGVDKVYDLNKLPWPFKKNEFNEIVLRNILEHLSDPVGVLNELHRISKNKAKIKIRVPHFSSANVWGNIEHKRGYNYSTFSAPNVTNKFKLLKREITFSNAKFFMRPFVRNFAIFYEKHFAYVFNAVDLLVELEVKK